jgi:hypothetical protein
VLDTLHLQNCSRLATVGQMAKLKQLHLKDMNVLSEFPLEQLEMLVLSGLTVEDFLKISPRLKSLKKLHLPLPSYRYGLLTFVDPSPGKQLLERENNSICTARY